jgi:hypothetical protein
LLPHFFLKTLCLLLESVQVPGTVQDTLSAREGGDEDHPADEGGAKTRASAASLEQILCLNKYRRF